MAAKYNQMNSIIFKPRNAILILLIFSLGIYYKTLNNELLSLDDKGLIYSYNNGNTNVKNYFSPQKIHSYYRPVIHLSFLVDYLIWMDNESGFHLTNIILHSLNAILVYILCLFMLNKVKESSKPSFIAFFASLLFVIHPINTEAVNFIASRTDILATSFVLISFLLFLYYKKSSLISRPSSLVFLFLSVLAYFMAILSKEVALTFPLIIIIYEYFSFRRLKSVLRLLILFTLPTAIYFYLRYLGASKSDIGIGKTIDIMDRISAGLFVDFTAAIGFYFKKIIYPFPLNFAIVEINKTFYFVIGIICLVVLLISSFKHKLSAFSPESPEISSGSGQELQPSAFLLWSIFLSFIPSIAISLTDISWTPYAERYLYLPSVFFCILFSFQLSAFSFQLKAKKSLPIFAMMIIVIWFSIATYNRNIIWLSNLTIWKDTIKKSPNFGKAYNEYGVALIMRGENERAKEQFLKAVELGYKTTPLFNLGHFAIRNNDFALAEKYFTKGIQIAPNSEAYRKLGFIYLEKSVKDNNNNLLKAIEYLEKAYEMNRGDDILALKLAVLYRRVNRYEDVKVVLQKVINDNPDSYIEKSAKKMLDKITGFEEKRGTKE